MARPEPIPPRRDGERPANPATSAAVRGDPPHLADGRALTILTTEHWSLLSARSLVYNEAFVRAGMFLTFLSASLVALGFVYQGGALGRDFPPIAVAVLALDLVVGLATLGRLISTSGEDLVALQGMNRIRHAYLELVPSLEPYFVSGHHDDLPGVLMMYGTALERPGALSTLLHGLTTTIGTVAVLDAALAGTVVAGVAVALGAGATAAFIVGLAAGLATMAGMLALSARLFARQGRRVVSRFPTPQQEA